MTPTPTPDPASMSTDERRALYHSLTGEVLAVVDMRRETEAKLGALCRFYPDTLQLRALLAGQDVSITPVETTPVPIPTREPGGHQAPGRKQRSYVTKPIIEITVDLVRDNPGRTSRQLRAALRELPEELRFYEDSLSPSLSNLASEGRIVRVLCDTADAPGPAKVKYYSMGAVPPGVSVIPAEVSVGHLGKDDILAASRPPTPAERGDTIEADLRAIS